MTLVCTHLPPRGGGASTPLLVATQSMGNFMSFPPRRCSINGYDHHFFPMLSLISSDCNWFGWGMIKLVSWLIRKYNPEIRWLLSYYMCLDGIRLISSRVQQTYSSTCTCQWEFSNKGTSCIDIDQAVPKAGGWLSHAVIHRIHFLLATCTFILLHLYDSSPHNNIWYLSA